MTFEEGGINVARTNESIDFFFSVVQCAWLMPYSERSGVARIWQSVVVEKLNRRLVDCLFLIESEVARVFGCCSNISHTIICSYTTIFLGGGLCCALLWRHYWS